jgi:hypothetical protein
VGVGVTASVSAPAAQAEGSGGCDSTTVIAAVAIVGVAAAGYAFNVGRGETDGVDPDYRYVVDCGSGGTRVEKFSITLDGICREVKPSPKAVPLHQALIEGEVQQKRWLAALAQALADDSTPIFIGATAGVRDSVASGVVTKAALKRFEELVFAQFGSRARFALVDGVLEATSELAAVRYCVSKRESARSTSALDGCVCGYPMQAGILTIVPYFCARQFRCPEDWWDRPTDSIALISSGGMSAQMTFPSDTGLVAVSIPHNQKEANGRIRDPQVGHRRHRMVSAQTAASSDARIYCLVHSSCDKMMVFSFRSALNWVYQPSRQTFNR